MINGWRLFSTGKPEYRQCQSDTWNLLLVGDAHPTVLGGRRKKQIPSPLSPSRRGTGGWEFLSKDWLSLSCACRMDDSEPIKTPTTSAILAFSSAKSVVLQLFHALRASVLKLIFKIHYVVAEEGYYFICSSNF